MFFYLITRHAYMVHTHTDTGQRADRLSGRLSAQMRPHKLADVYTGTRVFNVYAHGPAHGGMARSLL